MDVCMCVYDDVGVIIDFLMSRSTHTVACSIEPVDLTRSVSILICCSTGIQTARPVDRGSRMHSVFLRDKFYGNVLMWAFPRSLVYDYYYE